MNDIIVIYHSADLDGICCREIARKALGTTADYLGHDYGQPVPDLTLYTTVYLLDISLPIEVMREHAAKLIIIDHHKTLITAVDGIRFKDCNLMDGVAACRLTWQWFNEHRWASKDTYLRRAVTEPYAVRLLGEYDIWCKTDPNTDLFQLGMQAEKEPRWDVLFAHHAGVEYGETRREIDRIIECGRAIQAYTEVTNAQIATERGFDVTWEGLRWRALCTARCNSLTFTAALKPEHDGCLAYHWNGRAWRFSLYHAPHKTHLDLSAIARKHGGGGHPGACGFQLTQLPVEFGGPEQHMINVVANDTPSTRELIRSILAGDERAREAYHACMVPVLDEAVEMLRGDPRLAETTS